MTEHTQPEPDSGYALDRFGGLWRRESPSAWAAVAYQGGGLKYAWDHLDRSGNCGPMTPLLPAVRPDGVPDDAWPLGIPWGAWEGDVIQCFTPGGSRAGRFFSRAAAERLGYSVPAAPTPSLPERLDQALDIINGNEVLHGVTDGESMLTMGDLAELLAEARDALKAASQQ